MKQKFFEIEKKKNMKEIMEKIKDEKRYPKME